MSYLEKIKGIIRRNINPRYGRAIPIVASHLFNSSRKEKKFYISAIYFIILPILLNLLSGNGDVVLSGSGIAVFYAQTTTMSYIKSFYLSFFLGQLLLIILSADQIAGEIEMKTFTFLRSKPVYDSEVIFGKFLGMMMIIAVLDTPGLVIIYFWYLISLDAKYPDAYIGTLDEIVFAIIVVLLLQGIIIALTLVFSSLFNKSLYAILSSMLTLFILSTVSNSVSVDKANYISLNWLLDAIMPNIFYHLEPLEIDLPSLLGFFAGLFAFIFGLLFLAILIMRNKELQ